jgi:DNA repair exonuclease SbcCD ATPase subunit
MSTTSKVLAVLNLLALFAYIFLGSTIYSYRTDWQYQNFLMDRTLKGLPLNEDEVDEFGQLVAERLGTKDETPLKTILASAGGNPAGPTLLDEVKAVKNKVEGLLSGPDAGKNLEKFLMPLSNSLAERTEILQLLKNPNDAKTLESLKERADGITSAAINGKKKLEAGGEKSLSPEEHREAIGRFLWAAQSLDEDAGSPTKINRLLVMVGPNVAINVLTQSIRNTEEMFRQVDAVRSSEQANFVKAQSTLVSDIRALDLLEQRKIDERDAVVQKSEEQISSRRKLQSNRDELQKQLAEKREEANKLMTDLRTQGKSLCESRIKVLDAIKNMQQTENAIRQLEGLKPASQPAPQVGQ